MTTVRSAFSASPPAQSQRWPRGSIPRNTGVLTTQGIGFAGTSGLLLAAALILDQNFFLRWLLVTARQEKFKLILFDTFDKLGNMKRSRVHS